MKEGGFIYMLCVYTLRLHELAVLTAECMVPLRDTLRLDLYFH